MERELGSGNSSPSNTVLSNPNTTDTTSTNHGSTSTTTTNTNRQQSVSHISVYGGIADRQTVQVIQQALNRQPSAAQYLQQMYAAQQQHLMLQTAALQQQQLNLAAVQQASIAAGRQSCNQNGAVSQQGVPSQTTIKLAGCPATTSQLISRAQGVTSAPVNITQQTVLLGNSSTPTLTASQAQMYLRAQMFILTPTATVTTVQPELSSQPVSQQATNTQMQNLVLRGQQGAVVSSPSHSQLQGLGVKPSAGGSAQLKLSSQPEPQLKTPCSGPQGPQCPTTKSRPADSNSNESDNNYGARAVSVSHNMTTVTSHPLINTAYTQIQTHQLLQQHRQQFVIQQQSQLSQRSQAQLLQQASIQPSLQPQTQTLQALQAVAIQPALPGQQCAIPMLPKQSPSCQQATIFHSTVTPQVLAHNGQPPLLTSAKAKQLQIAAVNLPFQPPPAQTATATQNDADKDKNVPPAATEDFPVQGEQQQQTLSTHEPEQCLSDHIYSDQPEVPAAAQCVNAKPGVGFPPAMTSGNGNSAPTVTGSTPQNGESKTPQAIVKPQILTHVIEGFVIQEGAEPFPVERPSLPIENLKKQKQPSFYSDLETKAQDSHIAASEMEDLSQPDLKSQESSTHSCELCGKVDFTCNFKRSKRFCSTVCAKRYSVGCSKRMGLFSRRPNPENPKKPKASNTSLHNTSSEAKKQNHSIPTATIGSVSSPRLSHMSHGGSTHCSDMSSYEEPPSPLSVASFGAQRLHGERGSEHGESHSRELPLLTQQFLPSDPAKWNVEDVYEFICSLPGCQEIAEEFRTQEIDGQALLLLKEDHLMSTMNIKLGPALKIFARISMLKDS
ncbi:polyhomeotic-like protein 2 isoform X2 [Hoplias malabaricus]|uniref:polyhomeotic-like protein 2 isoform X2 n=1 Tax=Hoplias malabaricus TaxID=27720 RepID=UPI003462182E